MKTITIKSHQTRYPRLTRAILRRLNRDELRDVAEHGADSGFSGFTYYHETGAFFRAHKAEIIALAQSTAADIGEPSMLQMVRHFRCICNGKQPDYTEDEVAEAIYSGRGESTCYIRNALVWFALEEVALELNPEL